MPEIMFIHLTRRNNLRGYILIQIFPPRGPNHSRVGGRSDNSFQVQSDIADFLQNYSDTEANAQAIGVLLAGRNALDITYEELSSDTAAMAARVSELPALANSPSDIKPALTKVGAANLRNTVSNFQELLDNPVTRALALLD